MKKYLIGAVISAALSMGAGHAFAQSFTYTPGPYNPVKGTVVESINFDDSMPDGTGINGDYAIISGSTDINAAPLGDTSNYLSVPYYESSGSATMYLSGDANIYNNPITAVGFYLGSVDSYNQINFDFFDGSEYTINGTDFAPNDMGDRTSPDQNLNVLVNLLPGQVLSGINFVSNGYAIETDDYKFYTSVAPVSAAPEPSAWALMILGVGFAGYALRRQHKAPTIASHLDHSVAA